MVAVILTIYCKVIKCCVPTEYVESLFNEQFAIVGSFELSIGSGQFTDSEIIVMLGENGTGKTTFIRILAGKLTPDEGGETPLISLSITESCPTCSVNI
jgi:translation initiation factor RLI1